MEERNEEGWRKLIEAGRELTGDDVADRALVFLSQDERAVRCDYLMPLVLDERIPPGMAVVGYDKDGKLVALVNIDKAKKP